MDSNITQLCCLVQDNIILKNVIEQQTRTIGELIQEKNEIKEQYEYFIYMTSMNTSNIDNTSHIIENSSNI